MKKYIRSAILAFAACAMAGVGYAQVTLTDIGSATPTAGPNDISQTSTSGNTTSPDGLNYFSNNHVDWHNDGEPGQTFTTGTSPAGYVMTSIALKTGGLGNNSGIGSPASYWLHIFSVSSASATLLQTYTASISSFNDGDWLRWTNLAVPMGTNATYAWSFGLTSNSGYEPMAVASGNKYSGGQIAMVPVAGGTMAFGTPTAYDAVFDIGMSTNSSLLLAGAPTVSPASTLYIGSTVTLGVAATGDPPRHYQWLTDNGSGGALNNILDATNASLTLTPTNLGTFKFDYIVTNITGSATSSVATVSIVVGSPVVLPASTVYIGSSVTLTSPPVGNLTYQWQTDGGSGGSRTNIPSAINQSLTATPPGTGTFKFDYIVNNGSGSFTSSVANVTILSAAAVTVNPAQTMAAMPVEGLGVASAVYFSLMTSSGAASALTNAGISAIRYPGGSYADIFHWQTYTGCGGYLAPGDTFDNFINSLVTPASAKAIITVNYGSNPTCDGGGDTNEAAAWVHYANVTRGLNIKYWEIGNEQGGNGYYNGYNWEEDLHFLDQTPADRVGQSVLSPTAYGSNSVMFIKAMKAQDASIKCGVGFDTGRSSYNTAVLGQTGTNADFVIIHWYPSGDATALLTTSGQIGSIVNSTRTQLTNNVGAAFAAQMGIAVTETGASSGVNGTPAALFAADDFLTWIENGIVNVDYQELDNGFLGNSGINPGVADNTLLGPAYGSKMARLLANVGDTFLKTTSAQSLLHMHATMRQDGKTGVMFINTDPNISILAAVNISGPTLANSGIWYQFGFTNFVGANIYPTYPVSSNTVSGLGNSFTVSIPPYTMVDLLLSPAVNNTPPVLSPIGSRTVNVGSNIVFTASATDTDQPPQTLTFSLLSGPGNATLNTNSGAFAWRPAVTNANTTNAFALKVADNGSPILSATQSFNITVNPLTQPTAVSLGLNNGQLGFQVSGQTGPDYAVQVSSNLFDWSTLFITNSPPMPFTWTDTNAATLPSQFYRIKVGPPLP
jgi:hypothetical protein